MLEIELASSLQGLTWSQLLFLYPTRHFIMRSHKVSKPQDAYLEFYDSSEIWQAPTAEMPVKFQSDAII